MRLILKVDVDTLRGTREGVPRLLALLKQRHIHASFLFSLGPDHTGRAIKRVFRPGFFSKVQRTSVVEHYGIRTLLYGTLLPGPDIGRRCADLLRSCRDAGHETGIHTWDHVLWQDHVATRDAAWTQGQMELAQNRYRTIFGSAAPTHGAAGWQMNPHALRQLDAWGMAYSSDTRGTGPFRPRVDGQVLQCVQLPTTLATLDELIGLDGRDASGAARLLLERTAGARRDEVFTLHSELEGSKLLDVFTLLLDGWASQGYQFSTMGEYFHALDPATLPVADVIWGEVAGRSGQLAQQGSNAAR